MGMCQNIRPTLINLYTGQNAAAWNCMWPGSPALISLQPTVLSSARGPLFRLLQPAILSSARCPLFNPRPLQPAFSTARLLFSQSFQPAYLQPACCQPQLDAPTYH